MQQFVADLLAQIVGSILHNWIPLSLAIVIAAIMKVYVDPEKLKNALLRRSGVSLLASVAVGAFTPLCACGTTAVIIGLLTTTLPWGPNMAFLVSSPLMSPDAFVMLWGIIGWKFAVALAVASVVIGLAAGGITHVIELKTDFLKNQVRFAGPPQKTSCACAAPSPAPSRQTGGLQLCCAATPDEFFPRFRYVSPWGVEPALDVDLHPLLEKIAGIRWRELWEAFVGLGLKQILFFYAIFVGVGILITRFVPTEIIVALFNGGSPFAVPLAALIGLPIYVSGESAIPLIQALMAGGASGGSMLAFMITGPGTSAWVIAGITTIMKRNAIALYVLFLLVGGIALGYLYDLALALGI